MDNLTGKIASVVFSNKSNGFHVLKVKGDNGKSYRVCGNFPGQNISSGLKAVFSGQHEMHSTYGPQFTASNCNITPEKGRTGVIAYLTLNVQSIGVVTASKLYDYFGDNLIDVLNTDINKLDECSFLTKRQLDCIKTEWKTASDNRNSSIYLSNLGLSSSQIRSVLTAYGNKARETIANDPYSLTRCPGIGFGTADQAARTLNVGVDDVKRVRAMVVYSVGEMCNSEGHMYVTSPQIISYVNRRLFKKNNLEAFTHGDFLTETQYYNSLQYLLESRDLISVDDKIYTPLNYSNETGIAKIVAKHICHPPFMFKQLEQFLKDYQDRNHIDFSDDQKEAFLALNRTRFLAVSGYPGTGKTTLISAFTKLFENYNLEYTLLSPTGIAAKRLSQITGKAASTIHRALGYKQDGTWEFNGSNKYHADAIIVDEMSMVDSSSFFQLVSALDSKTILILVGDSAQLPSVGSGYVFNNLLSTEEIPNISLTKIFRQGKTSDIISVAHNILNNQEISTELNKDSEFIFFNLPESDVVTEVCKLSAKLKELGRNFQVISPMYEGILGVNNLNQELRSVLNGECSKKPTFIKSGETGLYEGDRVMVIKNDYDRNIFNGDVGKILRINIKDDEVEVKVFDWFDPDSNGQKYVDKIMTFTLEEARTCLKVAYACTTHKVQGQEFDYIIMPMTSQFGVMLYKNLVYTAITRAKKKVFVFGSPSAFISATRNDREVNRNSMLSLLIHDFYQLECAEQVMSA